MGRNVQFHCERFGVHFGTNLHDAVSLAKERKVENDKDGLASERDSVIKELVIVTGIVTFNDTAL